MGKILYQKLIRQYSDDGGLNWKNTDVWKVGEIIENPSNCEGQYVEGCYWKQLPISEGYLCDGVNKHYKIIELCNNNGIMKPSGRNKMGEIYETNSVDCGYLPPTPQYRWTESGTICNGFDKYVKEIEEESLDGGLTWTATGKERQGALIETNSKDCGYVPPTPSDDELAFEYDKYTLRYRLNGIDYIARTSPYSTTLTSLGISELTTCVEAFHNTNLTRLVKFPNTSKVTDMYRMFWLCPSLVSLNLSNFNTSNVTDMGGMFVGCSSLASLDVSSFDTRKVTNMGGMFDGCSSLTSLNLSNFNTSNVTDMGAMFYQCVSLTSLNLSSFNTSNVTDMGAMFGDCSSLTSLNLSSFNTSNVTDMGGMFVGCSSLASLNLSSFNTRNVTDMRQMFVDCSSLTSLNLSSFNTSKVTDMNRMFDGCSSLTSLNLSNFNTRKVTDMEYMFNNCKNLTELDLSGCDVWDSTLYGNMFEGCSKLTTIYMRNCSKETIDNIEYMLSIDLPGQAVEIIT